MDTVLHTRRRGSWSVLSCLFAWLFTTVAIAAVVSAMPQGVAVADDATTQVGAFTLSYAVEDGEATITGIVEGPSTATDFTLPREIEGIPVVAVGELAFESAKFANVTLQAPLRTLGANAFKSSSITSITFPSTIQYVPYQCFWSCASLAKVTFEEGATPEYFGTRAFMRCSSLQSIDIPPLMGYDHEWICENRTATYSGVGNWRIGYQCFSYCTSLSIITFLPGNPKGCTEYLKSGGMQFGNNASGMTVVNYCKGTTNRFGSTASWYFSLNFYKSKEDAENDTTDTHPWKRILYPYETNLLQILKGTTGAIPYEGSDKLPDLPADAKSAGMIWGVSDSAQTSARAVLASSLDVYPVYPGDMAHGWVSSPEIETAAAFNGLNLVNNDNAAYVRLQRNGVADLSGMAAYAADGSKLDSGKYTLVYEKATAVPRPGSSFYDNVWNEVDSAQINEAGNYRVHAVGVGDLANTKSPAAEFSVKSYRADVFDFTSESANEAAGKAAFKGVGVTSGTPLFMVVTPANKWQYGLVASGLSGVGGGQAILTDGEDTSSSAYLAIQASKATNIIFLGSEDELTKAVEDKVKQNVGKASYDTISGSSYEDLAVQTYSIIKEYGPTMPKPYNWGTTAIVASGTRSFDTAPIAQFAYQVKAPVFFTGESGNLSDDTLSALSKGGFERIVIAGDATYVSNKVEAAIKSATGVAPERMLAGDGNAYEKSKAFIAALQSSCTDDAGKPVNDASHVVVASGVDFTSVLAGAHLAAAIDGTLLTVSSSADAKNAERYLAEEFGDLLGTVYVVGDFSSFDPDIVERMESVWSTPMSYDIASNDTVESGGALYKRESGSSATLIGVADATLVNLDASSVTFAGKACAVTSIAHDALKGHASVQSVSSTAASVGASAFEGCTALAIVNLPSATSIGASAFSGCVALKSVSIDKMQSVGASMFEGCTALKTVTAKTATSIGARAFAGCKALSSASVPKVKTIGASAFENCAKLPSFTGAAVASIGENAFSGCKALTTATFTSPALAKVGAKAFFQCKKLKKLTMKTSKLKAAKVGDSAFKGMPAAAKVFVPRAKVKAYKAIFTKKGLSEKSQVLAV